MRRLIIRPEADADLETAYLWYEDQRHGLGNDLVAEVGATMERIQHAPFSYARVGREVRRAPVQRFPYAILFRPTDELLIVVAIYHLHRDPRSWRRRS